MENRTSTLTWALVVVAIVLGGAGLFAGVSANQTAQAAKTTCSTMM